MPSATTPPARFISGRRRAGLGARGALRHGRHTNKALQVAWDRDGAAAFGLFVLQRKTVVERTDQPISLGANAAERSWLVRARAAGIALYNDRVGRGRRRAA